MPHKTCVCVCLIKQSNIVEHQMHCVSMRTETSNIYMFAGSSVPTIHNMCVHSHMLFACKLYCLAANEFVANICRC